VTNRIRRLRRVEWAPEPPPPPDPLDWADLMAIAVLARSLEREHGEGSALQRALEAIELFDHSALAAQCIAEALREAYRAAPDH
jgi:hypothetical protein